MPKFGAESMRKLEEFSSKRTVVASRKQIVSFEIVKKIYVLVKEFCSYVRKTIVFF